LQVNKACENLINVVGEIEFELGVNSLLAHNYLTAVSHFKLGASHDHPGAMFNLGLCYEQGFGVNKDMKMVSFFFLLHFRYSNSSGMSVNFVT
jgi:TPR repeat protein